MIQCVLSLSETDPRPVNQTPSTGKNAESGQSCWDWVQSREACVGDLLGQLSFLFVGSVFNFIFKLYL